MARLFSKRQGGWVDLPEEQVQEAYMSGLYAFPSNTEVNIQLPDGRYGTISSEHLQDAFRAGATYDQADVRQERIESAEYDDRNLEAGGLAVARGLSFGLSDVLLDRLDLYSEEELAKLEKYNPNISLAGELTGAVAPALASGGTSLLARGLSNVTAAGLSAKAGIAAEKAIARRLGAGESVAGFKLAQKTADKMIQGGAALTGAATVEGALFGAVDGFSEQMLGRADRTAEQMLSHVGGITALSGGLGGVLGLASPLIGKGLSAINNSKFGDAVSKKTKDWESSILAAMHGGDKETYRKLLNPEYAHKVIFGSQKIADDAASQVGSFIDDAVDGLELATRAVSGSEKKRLMKEVVRTDNALDAVEESIYQLYDARKTIRNEIKDSVLDGPEIALLKKADAGIQKQIDVIANMVAKSAAEGDVAVIQFGEKLRATFKDDLDNGLFRGPDGRFRAFGLEDTGRLQDFMSQGFVDEILPEVFIVMDSLKRALGNVTYKNVGKIDDVTTSPLMASYRRIKNALENESLFGSVAATRQREVNQAFTQLIPAYQRFIRQFTTEGDKAGLGMASRAATEGEATVMATAESKAFDEQIEVLVDFRKRLKNEESFRTYDSTELENAYRELETVVAAAKKHADTFDDGTEALLDYRKKLEVLDKKSGSLRGNLESMKSGATPNAAKMEAIRKELSDVVDESIEVANSRPYKGLDEEAVTDDFLDAVNEHSKASEQFSVLIDEAKKNIAKAKIAKAKDPEGLADLEEKLGNLIQRSADHDNTKPLAKNYKVTKDLGEEQRRGRVAKWSKVESFLKNSYKQERDDSFRTFNEFVNNYENFLRVVERQYDGKNILLTAEKSQTLKGLSERHNKIKETFTELADIQTANKEVRSVHSPLTTMLSAVPLGGLAVGGVPGLLASAASAALVTPAAGMKRRAAIHGVKSLVASNLNKRATQVVNRIVKNTKPGAPQKARSLPILLALLGVKATGNPRDDARAAMNQMGQLADPDFLHSRLESSTKELAEAPKLREELFLGVAKHAGILADAASTDGAMNYDPITGQNEITRSDADVSKFMSIAEIGIGGTNVVADKMIAGTLTKAEGNAYREFYPIESQELIETIQVKLSNQGKRISWDDRALLTNLSGIAMTNTLTPMFIGAMQSVHEAAIKNASGRKGGNSLRKTGEASTTLVEQAMYG